MQICHILFGHVLDKCYCQLVIPESIFTLCYIKWRKTQSQKCITHTYFGVYSHMFTNSVNPSQSKLCSIHFFRLQKLVVSPLSMITTVHLQAQSLLQWSCRKGNEFFWSDFCDVSWLLFAPRSQCNFKKIMKLFRTAITSSPIHFLFPSAVYQTDTLIELRQFRLSLYQNGGQLPMCLSTFHVNL